MLNLFFILLIDFVNAIAIRQFSDDSCTQLSRLEYLENNCYSFTSTSSYLITACNCTIVEYNLYSSAMCFGDIIGRFNTQQNTCMTTRQMISCYEYKSGTDILENNFLLIFLFMLVPY